MSVRDRIRQWQQKASLFNDTSSSEIALKRTASAPVKSAAPKHQLPKKPSVSVIENKTNMEARRSLRLSVIFESETDESSSESSIDEDVEDAPREMALDDYEAEFMNLEATLLDVIAALNQKSADDRNSLGPIRDATQCEDSTTIEKTHEKEDESAKVEDGDTQSREMQVKEDKEIQSTERKTEEETKQKCEAPVMPQTPMEILDDILEMASRSFDKQVRYAVPQKIEELKRLINSERSDRNVAAKEKATPAPPPPPPPLPPPPPMEAPKAFKIARRGGKQHISQINVTKDESGEHVELRVKRAVPGMEMMNQLQNALRKRKNRESLRKKYEVLAIK